MDSSKLDLDILKPYGCAVFTRVTSYKYGKLGTMGKKCIIIRYFETSKGYVFIGHQESGEYT